MTLIPNNSLTVTKYHFRRTHFVSMASSFEMGTNLSWCYWYGAGCHEKGGSACGRWRGCHRCSGRKFGKVVLILPYRDSIKKAGFGMINEESLDKCFESHLTQRLSSNAWRLIVLRLMEIVPVCL